MPSEDLATVLPQSSTTCRELDLTDAIKDDAIARPLFSGDGVVKASTNDAQIREWQASHRIDHQIAAAIALWAKGKETGTVLPADTEFGRDLDFAASPSSYRRAKNLLAELGVLGTGHRPYYVA
jgi:hypothetical protein